MKTFQAGKFCRYKFRTTTFPNTVVFYQFAAALKRTNTNNYIL